MTKEDLLPLAKTYFDSDKTRTLIFGTEDKHFFNSEGDARSYCKVDRKYFKFTIHDFKEEKPVVKEEIVKAKTEAEIEKEIEAEIEAEEAAKKPKKQIKKKVKK